MNRTQVLIIGAGPTGLVLALWLTRLGVKVRIIDKTAEPGTTSRALAVHAICKRSGIDAKLVFGVIGQPFEAHCWVQRGSTVVVGGFEQESRLGVRQAGEGGDRGDEVGEQLAPDRDDGVGVGQGAELLPRRAQHAVAADQPPKAR